MLDVMDPSAKNYYNLDAMKNPNNALLLA